MTGDFDGNHRPQDGDRDCNAQVDAGTFEVSPPPLPRLEEIAAAIHCQRYVFDPGKWLFTDCIAVDCCSGCPGHEVLDWVIRVRGNPPNALALRFEGLDPAVARRVKVVGRAQWISANQLLMFSPELELHGLRGRESVLHAKPQNERSERLALEVTQLVEGATISETTLEYSAAEGSRL